MVICKKIKSVTWAFPSFNLLHSINEVEIQIFQIINLPGLYMIETVDSEKLAEAFNSRWEKVSVENKQPLKVLMQVNTSQEEG